MLHTENSWAEVSRDPLLPDPWLSELDPANRGGCRLIARSIPGLGFPSRLKARSEVLALGSVLWGQTAAVGQS